ncbi:MAG: TIGR00725 family protein [Candidatus Saelkia tenebricola]|nr:TIGR00725 family protein [Candidatus Saelkia tenebricola]
MLDYDFQGKIRIAVIGGSDASNEALKEAEAVGQLIAKNNCILVTGGLGGVMEAASRGAKEAGGVVMGILPGISRLEKNPYVDIAIPTGLGWIRNVQVVLNADVLIAIDGAYGTLSEISYALLYGKPVFGLKTWVLSKAEEKSGKGVISCLSPQEAVEKALKAVAISDG